MKEETVKTVEIKNKEFLFSLYEGYFKEIENLESYKFNQIVVFNNYQSVSGRMFFLKNGDIVETLIIENPILQDSISILDNDGIVFVYKIIDKDYYYKGNIKGNSKEDQFRKLTKRISEKGFSRISMYDYYAE